MPKTEDFKKPDGSFDYQAYNAAYTIERAERKAKGELCSQCGAFMLWAVGHPRRCGECEDMDKPGDLRHHSRLRCPKCGHNWIPWDSEDYDVMHDGDHDVTCAACDHEFEVSTSVSYSFTSPARQSDKEDSTGKGLSDEKV